jgi:ubiE/COQ5 methyltransferase family
MDTATSVERRQLHGMWASVAPAWGEHAEYADARGAAMTARLLELAAPRPGERVLELACGAGGVGIAAAGLVGPAGEVVLSDVAAEMTAIAAARDPGAVRPGRRRPAGPAAHRGRAGRRGRRGARGAAARRQLRRLADQDHGPGRAPGQAAGHAGRPGPAGAAGPAHRGGPPLPDARRAGVPRGQPGRLRAPPVTAPARGPCTCTGATAVAAQGGDSPR